MTGDGTVLRGLTDQAADNRFNHGPLNMRVMRDGTWFYHGTPIARKEMVCLFASMLTRREDGTYWLVAPTEEGLIEVEDVPFLAVELFCCGSGRDTIFSFRTNVDEIITLDCAHRLRVNDGDAPPYLSVRPGLEARLTRAVYYEMVALGGEEKIGDEMLFGIWSHGQFFSLGRL